MLIHRQIPIQQICNHVLLVNALSAITAQDIVDHKILVISNLCLILHECWTMKRLTGFTSVMMVRNFISHWHNIISISRRHKTFLIEAGFCSFFHWSHCWRCAKDNKEMGIFYSLFTGQPLLFKHGLHLVSPYSVNCWIHQKEDHAGNRQIIRQNLLLQFSLSLCSIDRRRKCVLCKRIPNKHVLQIAQESIHEIILSTITTSSWNPMWYQWVVIGHKRYTKKHFTLLLLFGWKEA